MPLLTTFFSSSCSTKSGILDSWFLVTFLCLTLSSSLEASSCNKRANTLGWTANVNNLLLTSEHLMNISSTTLQQFQKKFNCVLDLSLAEDPGNEQMIRKACMEESCYSGKKYDHQINHGPQTFASCKDTIYAILKSYLTDIQNGNFPDLVNAMNDLMLALNDSHTQAQPLFSSQTPLIENYEVQMKQCSILLILQQLSQTIHRSLTYLISLRNDN